MLKNIMVVILLLGLAAGVAGAEMVTSQTGLRYEDLEVGTGPTASRGSVVAVHYTGWLDDKGKPGEEFDSSKGRRWPFSFKIGSGQVIKGWDEGIVGMKAGGKRVLYIPAELGYGSRRAGATIPPNTPLIFEVELLEVNGVGAAKPWTDF